MLERIFTVALENGLISALFTGLLIFVLRDTSRREREYQSIIEELEDTLKVVNDIRQDVAIVKKAVTKGEVQNDKLSKKGA